MQSIYPVDGLREVGKFVGVEQWTFGRAEFTKVEGCCCALPCYTSVSRLAIRCSVIDEIPCIR